MPENDYWKIALFIFLPHLYVGANVKDPSRKPLKQWWGTLHSSAWQSAPWPLAGLGKCGRSTCKKTRWPFKLNKNKNKEPLELIISGHSHLKRTTHCHCCSPGSPHSCLIAPIASMFSVCSLHPRFASIKLDFLFNQRKNKVMFMFILFTYWPKISF